jgi:hypothetical protein
MMSERSDSEMNALAVFVDTWRLIKTIKATCALTDRTSDQGRDWAMMTKLLGPR